MKHAPEIWETLRRGIPKGRWIPLEEIYSIVESGLTLAGPAPHTLIDPIHPDDLRRAVLTILQEWWAPMIHDPVRLRHSGYQSYAILTICRMLYTLQHGAVVSKPAAARWAQAELDDRWSALIDRALAWEVQREDVNQTLDFIQYTLERSRQVERYAWAAVRCH